MTNKEVIEYWKSTAEHDYDTMISLYRSKRYDACLFFGHLILEKILKAHYVKTTKNESPHTHNLSDLAKLSKANLLEEELDFLADVNRFNIRTRYPDDKLKFYKACTLEYTKNNLDKIKKLFKKLCEMI